MTPVVAILIIIARILLPMAVCILPVALFALIAHAISVLAVCILPVTLLALIAPISVRPRTRIPVAFGLLTRTLVTFVLILVARGIRTINVGVAAVIVAGDYDASGQGYCQ